MKIINDLRINNLISTEHKANDFDINFKEFLVNSIEKLNQYEKTSNEMGLLLATGEIDNIQDVMIANQKAEITLQFAIEVKNQILDAYREIMRIQL